MDDAVYNYDEDGKPINRTKTITFVITEDVPTFEKELVPWITYDTTPKSVTVTLTDDLKGTITATANRNGNDISFINTYSAEGEWIPGAKKVLEGRDLKAGEFSFTLTDSSSKVIETKTNTADGKVTFSALNFTEADAGKTFTYTITEVKGSDKDVTYDEHTVTLTIKVTDNGDGTLKV